jgi:hypothetical protein
VPMSERRSIALIERALMGNMIGCQTPVHAPALQKVAQLAARVIVLRGPRHPHMHAWAMAVEAMASSAAVNGGPCPVLHAHAWAHARSARARNVPAGGAGVRPRRAARLRNHVCIEIFTWLQISTLLRFHTLLMAYCL